MTPELFIVWIPVAAALVAAISFFALGLVCWIVEKYTADR